VSGWSERVNCSLIEERDLTGAQIRRYVHEAAVDEILMMVDAAGAKYYLHDALGSTTALTDSSGAIVESYRYDVFGKVSFFDATGSAQSVSSVDNRFLFTGREWIAQASLYDYRNRVYSPVIGRFMQIDPIRFNAGDVNMYRYVGNGVVISTDPSGLVDKSYTSPNCSAALNDWEKSYNDPNTYDFAAHSYDSDGDGSPDSFWDENENRAKSPSEAADEILADPNYSPGDPVQLISCKSGKGKNSIGKKLAEELAKKGGKQTKVKAPTSNVGPKVKDGEIVKGSKPRNEKIWPLGRWRTFKAK
jgi:RHS repeat-associated protein